MGCDSTSLLVLAWPGLDLQGRPGYRHGLGDLPRKGHLTLCVWAIWPLVPVPAWLCQVACLPWLLLQDPLQGWAAAGLSWVRLGRRSQAWPKLNPKCEFEKNLGEMGP